MASSGAFDLASFLEHRRALVNDALDRALPAQDAHGGDPGRLREAMRYAVLGGGKRIRPMVTIAACEAAGGRAEQALGPCCALELVHAYSLVHDDLPCMDDDAERRGMPTVHVAFGEANAVLVGDALLTRAFECIGRASAEGMSAAAAAQAVQVLAAEAGIDGMVGGQALDIAFGQDIQDLEQLERVHALKTGALYAAAGAMGALSAGADASVVESLRRWGRNFGVAFQHADDVLDDDQVSLREQALARVDGLVGECDAISSGLGAGAGALRALAAWVRARARRGA